MNDTGPVCYDGLSPIINKRVAQKLEDAEKCNLTGYSGTTMRGCEQRYIPHSESFDVVRGDREEEMWLRS
jgi:hypothetical protein